MSSRSSVDRAPARCSGGHGFDSCRGLRIFHCPTLVSCWLIHLHKSYLLLVRIMFLEGVLLENSKFRSLSNFYTLASILYDMFWRCLAVNGDRSMMPTIFWFHCIHKISQTWKQMSLSVTMSLHTEGKHLRCSFIWWITCMKLMKLFPVLIARFRLAI